MEELKYRVAVVTGGASGIGKAITQNLASQGAITYVFDIDENSGKKTIEALRNEGHDVHFLACDVSDQASVKKCLKKAFSHSNRLDILINNAGVSHIGTAEHTTKEDFDRIVNINIRGVYNCLYVSIPLFKKSQGGVIINMTSAAATVGLPDRFAYSMSKGAVSTMTLSVARDYITDNIRCNGVAPGRVHTPFVDNYLKKNYPGQEREMFEKLAKTQPIGRMGTPKEIADLILYLVSDRAAFITGSIFPIDGGFITLNT